MTPALPRNDLNANPYGVGEQLRRVVWGAVQATLFRLSPQPMRAWRRVLLRCFGARIGPGAAIHRTARIEFPWRLAIGAHTSLGRGVWVYNVGDVTLGAHVTVSALGVLCSAGHDLADPSTPLVRRPIVIDDHAWIAMDVFVGPGVHVGRGCVIGARSAVFKDMPADTLCHGHPCEPRRPRDGGTSAAP